MVRKDRRRSDGAIEGTLMIFVTAVRLGGDARHEHITDVQWMNPTTRARGQTSRAKMVEWIHGGGDAYVSNGSRAVRVGVVDALPPYLRTYADGVWTDNLLALPRF
jgi:hypothetical protein